MPVGFAALVSVRSLNDIIQHGIGAAPHSFTLDNYLTALEGGVGRGLENSLIITVPTVLVVLLISSMAAFALSRYRIPFRRAILAAMLIGNLLPPQVLLIPVFHLVQSLGLLNELVADILVQIGFGIGFYTFVLHGFMYTLPDSITEAAVIDGASPVVIYWRIIIPLIKPALAGLGALAATWTFSDFIWAITVLQVNNHFPVTAVLFNFLTQYISSWNVVCAGAVIAALPGTILFLLFQRQMVSGLLVGAVK
jgi:multiple sugar transport system permease protein